MPHLARIRPLRRLMRPPRRRPKPLGADERLGELRGPGVIPSSALARWLRAKTSSLKSSV